MGGDIGGTGTDRLMYECTGPSEACKLYGPLDPVPEDDAADTFLRKFWILPYDFF